MEWWDCRHLCCLQIVYGRNLPSSSTRDLEAGCHISCTRITTAAFIQSQVSRSNNSFFFFYSFFPFFLKTQKRSALTGSLVHASNRTDSDDILLLPMICILSCRSRRSLLLQSLIPSLFLSSLTAAICQSKQQPASGKERSQLPPT